MIVAFRGPDTRIYWTPPNWDEQQSITREQLAQLSVAIHWDNPDGSQLRFPCGLSHLPPMDARPRLRLSIPILLTPSSPFVVVVDTLSGHELLRRTIALPPGIDSLVVHEIILPLHIVEELPS